MGKSLVLKNVDFSSNKLATVSFIDEKPCTAIALNKSTSAITSVGSTDTLSATLTPSDTTDSVVWSTSNAAVATVASGVVTATGCGTATITATCGTQTATCSVTVTHVAVMTRLIDTYLSKDSNKDRLSGGDNTGYGIGYAASGTLAISASTGFTSRYPIVIPNGAAKIVVANCDDYKPVVFWLSSTTPCSNSTTVALAYAKDDAGTFPSDPGGRTITIPDRTTGTYEGMDAIAFCARTSETITQEAFDAITVTFTA